MWKNENDVGTQPTATVVTYSEAVDKFTKSATAFMEHVHHLTQARDAYKEAMTVSTAIRNSLDAGDQALRSVLVQLEQAVILSLVFLSQAEDGIRDLIVTGVQTCALPI